MTRAAGVVVNSLMFGEAGGPGQMCPKRWSHQDARRCAKNKHKKYCMRYGQQKWNANATNDPDFLERLARMVTVSMCTEIRRVERFGWGLFPVPPGCIPGQDGLFLELVVS